VTEIALFLVILIQYTTRHSMINHCDRNITLLSDTGTVCISINQKSDISVTVIYHAMSLSMLYQYQSEEWYFCHSDLSCYITNLVCYAYKRKYFCFCQPRCYCFLGPKWGRPKTYIYTPSVFRIHADIQGWITNENMRNKLNS
jgi:hypothetical protein